MKNIIKNKTLLTAAIISAMAFGTTSAYVVPTLMRLVIHLIRLYPAIVSIMTYLLVMVHILLVVKILLMLMLQALLQQATTILSVLIMLLHMVIPIKLLVPTPWLVVNMLQLKAETA